MWRRDIRYTRIKLCEFESLDSACEASTLGVDALGFHVFRHQAVDEKTRKFAEFFSQLPGEVERVLLTDVDFDTLVSVSTTLRPDAVQLYPDWPAEVVDRLRTRLPGIRILKVMSAQSHENAWSDDEFLRHYERVVDAILLDSARVGGTGRLADLDHCARIVAASPLPVFLAGGLTPENVGTAIDRVRPFGVDVESGVSHRLPSGALVKCIQKCTAFVDAVARADRAKLRTAARRSEG